MSGGLRFPDGFQFNCVFFRVSSVSLIQDYHKLGDVDPYGLRFRRGPEKSMNSVIQGKIRELG